MTRARYVRRPGSQGISFAGEEFSGGLATGDHAIRCKLLGKEVVADAPLPRDKLLLESMKRRCVCGLLGDVV